MSKTKQLHPLAKIFIFAVVLVTITFCALYIFAGFRYINDKAHELKFIGIYKNGSAVSGKIYYYDGRIATLNAEKKTIESKDGDKYIGALSGYLPHGKGIMTKVDGSIIEGDFYDGYCTGNATITYSNGDIYIGSVDHEIREGQGKYIVSNGTVYEGEFKNGDKNGFGITTFSDGSVYIGEYQNSVKHGYGAYLFNGGDIYIGNFELDKRTGNGIYLWSKSEEYSSEFENLFAVTIDQAFKESYIQYFKSDFNRYFVTSENTLTETENTFFAELEKILMRTQLEYYIGEFKANELTGKGKYRWLSGRIYEGEFENGLIVYTTEEPEENN